MTTVPFYETDEIPWFATVEAQESVVETWELCYNPTIGTVPKVQREDKSMLTFTVLPSDGGYRVYQHLGKPAPDNRMAVINQFTDNQINLEIVQRLAVALGFVTYQLNQQTNSYPDAFGARIDVAHRNGVWTLVWADTGRPFDINRVWRPVGDHLRESRRAAEALWVLADQMRERMRLVQAS